MKRVFYHGIVSGALAAIAAIVYNYAYSQALAVNFSRIVNNISIAGVNIAGCLIASLGYYIIGLKVTKHTDVVFNIVFMVLTFASCAGPFAAQLPTSIQSPELFIGLTIPMHFFPQLFWLVSKPLFETTKA